MNNLINWKNNVHIDMFVDERLIPNMKLIINLVRKKPIIIKCRYVNDYEQKEKWLSENSSNLIR